MLTNEQIELLELAGFTELEIENFNVGLEKKPQEIDLTTEAWVETLNSRRALIDELVFSGYNPDEIVRMLDRWNEMSELKDPIWSFFREEYQKLMSNKNRDFEKAWEKRLQSPEHQRIAKLYGLEE
jgi:hypothetical protein